TEILGRRRGLVAQVEAEWRKPLDQLLGEAPEVAGDLEWLRQENERLRAAIDAVGPVNALAVDEPGEEMKRLEFRLTQRDALVAVSLLFAIFLTKPSPFCLLDEVDAPLDDANVGRYVRLLAEFKDLTQFIVITHNPRTMQAADAVYGVTMQEPGVSTIVGVRL